MLVGGVRIASPCVRLHSIVQASWRSTSTVYVVCTSVSRRTVLKDGLVDGVVQFATAAVGLSPPSAGLQARLRSRGRVLRKCGMARVCRRARGLVCVPNHRLLRQLLLWRKLLWQQLRRALRLPPWHSDCIVSGPLRQGGVPRARVSRWPHSNLRHF